MPRRELGIGSIFLAALAVTALSGLGATSVAGQPATNPDTDTVGMTLKEVESALQRERTRAGELDEQAGNISKDLEQVRAQMIEAAKASQEQEAQITELEATLDELRASEDEKTAAFHERRTQLSKTLGALERLSLYPPEALAAFPESPVDTVRSALLLRAAVPAVEAQASKLRFDISALQKVRAQIVAERSALESAKQRLASDNLRLASLFGRKDQLYRETEVARRAAEDHMNKLSSQARDLRDLMDRVEAERARREAAERARAGELAQVSPVLPPAESSPNMGSGNTKLASIPADQAPAIRQISTAQGRLTLPARGQIVKEFGVNEEFGNISKGITLRTRPGAQVVASFDGQVAFAGPFRGYGQILIIEHSEGYHTLLSGLSRIDVAAGQWVLAGEPVGIMGSGESGGPELYVELRRNGRPIDPLPWLALHNGKVSG
ncbi:MAG TPA: peptidoglycan DD-metalloendopeptidase family protein [Alphaproteobacteria bacterium]|nr:peptidoglycan DD-metalloendopeptidase family protein [Alphaproteobacteria bacterium]